MRVFLEQDDVWEELPHLAGVTWTETSEGLETCEVSYANDVYLAPDRILIVPSYREDLEVPCYGPYDVTAPRYNTPNGTTLSGTIGHDFAQLFALGQESLLARLVADVQAFTDGGFEPYAGWGATWTPTDGPYAAKLGEGYGQRLQAPLWNAAALGDVETALAEFGLRSFVLATWASGVWTNRLVVWPRYPILRVSGGVTTYGVFLPFNAVTSWAGGLPVAFQRRFGPNRQALPEGDFARWAQRPVMSVPELLNSPIGPHPTWSTRRVVVSFRTLGQSDTVLFRTGSVDPALHIPPTVGSGQTAKLVEELRRWDLQNTAARWTASRVIDDTWATLPEVVLPADQILDVPEEQLPEGWPPHQRSFTVRSVRHQWSPVSGYIQQVEAALWQGGFARLRTSPNPGF